MPQPLKPKFFATPDDFRKWLIKNHRASTELWVGYFKKDSGKPSITWPESVDQALCFGWIDGVRKSIDHQRYTIRFTPRKPQSTWSTINIKRMRFLIKNNLVQPAGRSAFEARKSKKSGIYSYEQRSVDLAEPYLSVLKKRKTAWTFYEQQPPSYRKVVNWWIVSAVKEETRLARLQKLVLYAEKGERLPETLPPKARRKN